MAERWSKDYIPEALMEGVRPGSTMLVPTDDGQWMWVHREPEGEYVEPQPIEKEKYTMSGGNIEYYDYVVNCKKCGTEFMAYKDEERLSRFFCPGCGELLEGGDNYDG